MSPENEVRIEDNPTNAELKAFLNGDTDAPNLMLDLGHRLQIEILETQKTIASRLGWILSIIVVVVILQMLSALLGH